MLQNLKSMDLSCNGCSHYSYTPLNSVLKITVKIIIFCDLLQTIDIFVCLS
jgi:hypothetical protein